MADRIYDRNSLKVEIPNIGKKLQGLTSSFDTPSRQHHQNALCNSDSVGKEDCPLRAINDEDQPLLHLRSVNGGALQSAKELRGCTRIDHVPKLSIPQKKRSCSLTGLVTSNDFFIPCPLTPTSAYLPATSARRSATATPQTPRKEVLADSLRGQYTPATLPRFLPVDASTHPLQCEALIRILFQQGPNYDGGIKGPPDAYFHLNSSNLKFAACLCAIRFPEKYKFVPRLSVELSVFNSNVWGRVNEERKLGRWILGESHQSQGTMYWQSLTKDLEKKLQEQGIALVYYPEPRCGNMQFGNVARVISDLRVFLMRPVPHEFGPIECHVHRDGNAKWLIPSYRLYLSDGDRFLLSSKKRKKNKTNYILSLDDHDISKQSGNYFGRLRSNFVGSEYWFYDKGKPPAQETGVGGTMRLPTAKDRVEMGAVKYHINVLGIGGPRKMTAIIPSLEEDGKPHVFAPAPDGGPVLLDHYKNNQHRNKMVVMHNKQPHFNKQLAAYCLNFNGRVTKPSVKNFQLVADSDKDTVILQFGKIGRNLFTMDYRHPLSAFQAFSICLSSLDPKLACE